MGGLCDKMTKWKRCKPPPELPYVEGKEYEYMFNTLIVMKVSYVDFLFLYVQILLLDVEYARGYIWAIPEVKGVTSSLP